MGQPSRVSPTNVLPFPRAQVEEANSSPLRQSQAEDDRAGVIERPAQLAPRRPGILNVYWTVTPHSDDRRATLDALKRPYIVSSSALRFLVIALVLLAVLPSLSAAAILWLSQTGIEPLVNASSNHAAVTEAIITLPSITTPTMLKATAGENTRFPIAVNGSDPVEGGGTISISRLPVGSTFSAGVADGETRWKVAPGQIDNLHLVLPRMMPDETTLMIELLAPDGHVISDAATIVEVANTPEKRIPVRRVKTEVIAGDFRDQPGQEPEATDADAELITQARALQSDSVPLPTRRPGPRR